MFCFLAGAMVTVTATAAGVWFDFPMPGLNDLYPNSVGWVVAVLVMGAFITVVAAYGYKVVAHIANIAAPWMVLVFLAFGLVGLPGSSGIDVARRLLAEGQELIWKGGDAAAGPGRSSPSGTSCSSRGSATWRCTSAWPTCPCFASRGSPGTRLATAAGMYLGPLHGVDCGVDSLCAAAARRIRRTPTCCRALWPTMRAGIAGLICVIVAGWTTANPTIYRAGPCLPGDRPLVVAVPGDAASRERWPRVAGMFPAIAMKLLDFVALYGLVLMPMGAVIFVDFWLAESFGFRSRYAEASGRRRSTGRPA